jgi:hypothetical protein
VLVYIETLGFAVDFLGMYTDGCFAEANGSEDVEWKMVNSIVYLN